MVFSTPVRAIEAWIIAALYPQENKPKNIADPAKWLVTKKKLRPSKIDGKPWKDLHLSRDFAPLVARRIARVRSKCAEAERTLHAIEQRRSALERGGRRAR